MSINDDTGSYIRVILFAGDKETSFNASIKEDNIIEANENFSISIIRDSLPYNITVGKHSTTTVIIIDSKCYFKIYSDM